MANEASTTADTTSRSSAGPRPRPPARHPPGLVRRLHRAPRRARTRALGARDVALGDDGLARCSGTTWLSTSVSGLSLFIGTWYRSRSRSSCIAFCESSMWSISRCASTGFLPLVQHDHSLSTLPGTPSFDPARHRTVVGVSPEGRNKNACPRCPTTTGGATSSLREVHVIPVIERGVRRRDDLGHAPFAGDRRLVAVFTSVRPPRNIAIHRESCALENSSVLFRGAPFQKIS